VAGRSRPVAVVPRLVAYLSFGEQALQYFDRPHESVARRPLTGPCAWRGADLRDSGEWVRQLGQRECDELESIAAALLEQGRPLRELARADFELASMLPHVDAWRHELIEGRGFVVVRGLPVKRWGERLSSIVYWGLGLHLGRPGAQNPDDDLLGHVWDTGRIDEDPDVRRYLTSGEIRYHCDLADVVGLLCLETARSGGASRIVSSQTVYNELLSQRPDLVEMLYEPFLLDARNEDASSGVRYVRVTPCRFAAGRLRTFYHSDYFRSVVRNEDVPPFTESERELMDLYEEIAARPDLRLDMQLRQGDIQWLSNHSILHARTAYEDGGGANQRRHLLRLWLSL
jgi:hypothetical protein